MRSRFRLLALAVALAITAIPTAVAQIPTAPLSLTVPVHVLDASEKLTSASFMLSTPNVVGNDTNRNRDTPEVDDLIGFFVDTVVVRTSLDGNPSVDELLRRVRTSTLDAHQHAALPFERLVDELAPPRKPGQHPFTQVMCVFQPARPNGLELGGLDVELAPVSTGTAKYDLTLHVEDHGEDVELALIGASDMFDPATLELLADELCAVLADLPTEGMRLDDLGGSEADEDAALLAIIDEHDRGTSRD